MIEKVYRERKKGRERGLIDWATRRRTAKERISVIESIYRGHIKKIERMKERNQQG